MIKTAQAPTAKSWTKPELVRLGKIVDVAGPNPNPTQNGNNS